LAKTEKTSRSACSNGVERRNAECEDLGELPDVFGEEGLPFQVADGENGGGKEVDEQEAGEEEVFGSELLRGR
jgi:hypothetical protein